MPPRASSSTSSDPSASKKRKTAQVEVTNDAPSPSTTFFFADGNVLLHVESTLFKVHKSVLEKAEVFADTLLVGSNEGGGIPTIKLEDKTDDWRVLLRAMYDGLSFFQKLPTLLETRSLLLLSDKYDHSSILAASKATFLARSMHEQELNIKMGVEESDPYQHDNAFQPFSSEALRALLALQEEFSLDSTSVRWIHNLIAVLDPPLRLRFLKRKEEEEGGQAWPPPLPDRTHLSILLRVESLARLTAQTLLVNFDTLHHPDCEIDSDCKEDQDLISNEIYKHLARQNSYEAVIVGRLNVIDDASNSIEDGCRVKLREFWTAKMRELDAEKEKDFDP
ncbi:hypothetical protein BDY24DRAFT_122491 [Mrakia frigida]|uniref:BTB/POZ domain-containing protein n=1 Tax=Mrakia frigida TaxID=29902 RepID=UPI003FCC028F